MNDDHGSDRSASTASAKTEPAATEGSFDVETLLRAVAEHSTDGIFVKDVAGRYLFVNPVVERLAGKSAAEIVGRDDESVFGPEAGRLIRARDRHVMTTGESCTFDQVLAPRGDIVVMQVTKSCFRDAHGALRGIVGIARDVTNQRRLEKRVSDTRLLQAIADASPLTLYVFDLRTRQIVYSNMRAWSELGHPPQAATGQDWNGILALLHPDDAPRLESLMARWGQTSDGEILESEYRLRHADGTWHWFRSRDTVLTRGPAGEVIEVVGTLEDITASKRAGEELKASEARFRVFVDHVADAMFLHDESSRIQDVNARACERLGYSRDELLGQFPNLFDPRFSLEDVREISPRLVEGQVVQFETIHRRKDGHEFPVQVRLRPFRIGDMPYAISTAHDISQRKAEESQKRKHQELLSASQELSHLGSFEWTLETGALTWSDELYRIYGRIPNQPPICMHHFLEHVHEEDREPLERQIAEAVAQKKSVRTEKRIRRPDGEIRIVESQIKPTIHADGHVHSLVGACLDITDRRRAEEALRVSEQKFRALVEHAFDGITLLNREGQVTYVGPSAMKRMGYLMTDVFDTNGLSLIHPDDQAIASQTLTQVLQSPESMVDVRVRLRHKNGDWRWLECRLTNLLDNPAVGHTVINWHDVTERQLAELELRESEQRFRLLADSIPQIVWTSAPTGELTDLNVRATEYTGLPKSELIGWKWGQVIHPDDLQRTLNDWRSIIATARPAEVEFRIRRVDGTYRWHICRQVPNHRADGVIVQWFGTCTDIEDQKRAESILSENNFILTRIAADEPLADILTDIVTTIERQLPNSLCSILLADEGGTELRLGAAPSLPQAYNDAVDGLRIGPCAGSCGTACFRREPVVVTDVTIDPLWADFRDLAGEHGLRACWSVPIVSTSSAHPVLGTFAIYHRVPTAPDTLAFQVIERAARLTRIAIERATTIRSLREREEQFRTLAECFPDPIFVLDPDDTDVPLRIQYVNSAVTRTHGYRPAELIGMSMSRFVDMPKSGKLATERARRILSGESISFEAAHRRADGGSAIFEVRASIIPWRGRRAILGIDRDVTHTRHVENQLRLLGNCVSRINDIIMITDAEQHIVFVNEAFTRQTGYSAEDVLGRSPRFLQGDRTNRVELERITQAIAARDTVRVELLNYKKSGEEILLELEISPITDETGSVTHFVAVERDITERKRSELMLQESEERLRLAIEAAGSVAFVWDIVNDRVHRYHSTEPALPVNPDREESLADVAARVHPADRELFHATLAKCLEEGTTYHGQFRFVRDDGTHRWLEEYGTLKRDATGRPIKLTGISIDVTDRKSADEERSRLWNLSLDLLCVGDLKIGRFKQVNPAWSRMLGIEDEELLSRPWLDFVLPEDHPETILASTRLAEGKPILGFENRYRCRDGTIRWLSWNATPMAEGDSLVFCVVRDVTRQKKLEEELLQSQKMEAIGQLAGGIAHDFNNLLTVMRGYASLLDAEIDPSHAWHEPIREILASVQSATDLVSQLLTFSRKQPRKLAVLNLNQILAKHTIILRRLLGDGIIVNVRLGARKANIEADAAQIERVLLNLAVNARDAMRGRGELTIETADDAFADPEQRENPQSAVRLVVRDTGVGMDLATQRNVFEPFFTTKPVGQGTGLGLSTVYAIVRQSNGTISVESEPGHGTAFIIHFPTVGEKETDAVPSPAKSVPPPTPHSRKTLLLVEDFVPLRTLSSRILREAGYTVLEAGDGVEALEVLDRHGQSIDLLITDLMMPRMSGADLAKSVRERQPDVRLLFMSGYANDEQRQQTDLIGACRFLQKPYSPTDLIPEVRRMLDNPPE